MGKRHWLSCHGPDGQLFYDVHSRLFTEREIHAGHIRRRHVKACRSTVLYGFPRPVLRWPGKIIQRPINSAYRDLYLQNALGYRRIFSA